MLYELHPEMLAFVDEVHATQAERNEVLHSRWLLRGRDAMRPVAEFLQLDEAERAAYLDAWDREAITSDEWQRQPHNDMALTEPHRMDELVRIERRLARAVDVAARWSFRIASMRETGTPSGWQGP